MMKLRSSSTLKAVMISSFLFVLVGVSGVTGYYVGHRAVADTQNPGIDLKLFWQAWNIIDQKFYGDKPANSRVDGAVSGMVAGLKDPYTLYMPPSQNKLFKSSLEGNFGGIGAELTVRDGALMVMSVLDGTPAQAADLKTGDVIIKIDGTKTEGMNFDDAINKIRGTKGTQVELTIGRQGVDKPFPVKITRDTIVVKSVKTETIGANKEIAYIKVNQFGDDTEALFQQALTDAKTSGKKGMVIDLRDNPGGFLNAAVDMIGMVLPATVQSDQKNLANRVAVFERSRDGKEQLDQSTTSPILDTLPMVVVVNSGSASASEIFSGAMKDYKRAQVIGTKTFGKGSVQDLIPLDNGGSIKVTIAKWFTPLGNGIDGTGITPDTVVELPDNTPESSADVQVQKALSLLP